MSQTLHIRPHALSQDVGVVTVRAGQSLADMLREAVGGRELAEDVVVRVGGYEVPPELWARVRPKPGTHILAYRTDALQGGSARQILGAVIMIAVAVFAPYLGAWAAGAAGFGTAAAWSAGFMMLGTLAVSALTRPPTPGGGGQGTDGNWYQLTGTSNQINPWGVIPFVIGEHRFFPPHAAIPYSEAVGDASYQVCMFDLGYGNIEVEDIRIGETPIEDYDEVDYEITTTPTLYPSDVAVTEVAATMEDDDVVTRTTATATTRISLDLVYGQGLFGVGTSGKGFDMWVKWKVEYRAAGSSGSWTTPSGANLINLRLQSGQFVTYAQNRKPFAAGISWNVPAGQYEVRVTRVDSLRGGSKNTYVDACTWTLMRSIKTGNPPSSTGTNKLCLRIKASDQLTGSLQNLSCLVKQKFKVFDSANDEWTEPVTSKNPAWAVWWLLTECPAVARHVPESRLDFESFKAFGDYCHARGFVACGVCDSPIVLQDLANDILACALGSLGMRDGRYTVVFDQGDAAAANPDFTFSPTETANFRMQRPFILMPHALRVQFVNPEANWQQDEIIVLDDGYSYRGVDARGNASSDPEPTRFETLQLRYAADAFQAWQVGRYHLAQGKFRSAVYSWDSDIAGIGIVRGDCVQVPNDVLEWGDGWGRVLRVEDTDVDGAGVQVVLDQVIATDADKTYQMRIRRGDGTMATATLAASGGETNVFALVTDPDVDTGDAVTLVSVTSELQTLLVTGVAYSGSFQGDHFTTSFTAVAYDSRVAPYWSDPPETIISEISGLAYGIPPPPVVDSVTSGPNNGNPNDAGTASPIMHVHIAANSRKMRDMWDKRAIR